MQTRTEISDHEKISHRKIPHITKLDISIEHRHAIILKYVRYPKYTNLRYPENIQPAW